jgi:hypothetical protein
VETKQAGVAKEAVFDTFVHSKQSFIFLSHELSKNIHKNIKGKEVKKYEYGRFCGLLGFIFDLYYLFRPENA